MLPHLVRNVSAILCAAASAVVISCQRGLMDRFVGVALSHQFAALLAVGVKMITFGRRHELTDLVQASRRQPTLPPASLNGKAIRCLFIWTSELVTALVGVNPEFDGVDLMVLSSFELMMRKPGYAAA
jgi:hypothetical protein